MQTVKYFNNEAFEADKYDEFLKSKLLKHCSSSHLTSRWLTIIRPSSERWIFMIHLFPFQILGI